MGFLDFITDPIGGVVGGIVDIGAGLLGQQIGQGFSERSAKSRYQWTMKDLEKAGLNPIIAGLGGVSAPAGTSARPTGAVAGVNSALMAKKQQVEIAALKENTRLARNQNRKIRQLLPFEILKLAAEGRSTNSAANVRDVETMLLKYQLPKDKLRSEMYDSKAGKYIQWLETFMNSGGRQALDKLPSATRKTRRVR